MAGWIGVDLDGTLAKYGEWMGSDHIGEPVPSMVARVKQWLSEGREVRIFTARVSVVDSFQKPSVRDLIAEWCEKHIGQRLEITCCKDYGMVELWDDRCVRVVPNTGEPCCGQGA